MYVLFTCGEAKGVDTLSLTEKFFQGKESDVDVRVHVLYRDVNKRVGQGDIIWQYSAFAKVFDMCVKRFGRTAEVAEKVIQLCRSNNILAEYLKLREWEVRRTMLAIFEQEEAEEIDRRILVKEVTEEVTKEDVQNAIKLVKTGKMSLNDVPVFFPRLSKDDIEEIRKEAGL